MLLGMAATAWAAWGVWRMLRRFRRTRIEVVAADYVRCLRALRSPAVQSRAIRRQVWLRRADDCSRELLQLGVPAREIERLIDDVYQEDPRRAPRG